MKNWFSKKNILTLLLLIGLVFSLWQIGRSASPDPGHPWADIGDSPSDALTVSRGGTATSSLAAENVVLGNNGSAVRFIAPGTAGNVLTSNGTTWSSSELGGLVLLNPATSETNSSVIASSATETTLLSWVLNVAPSTYRYYILEATVMGDQGQAANANANFNWNFKEGANLKRTYSWNLIARTSNAGIRQATVIKTIVDNSLPASANFLINGQMSIATATITMMAHSFRVYGVK